jgi:hypothetical protein
MVRSVERQLACCMTLATYYLCLAKPLIDRMDSRRRRQATDPRRHLIKRTSEREDANNE